jgi:hypothetical protein
MKFMSLSLQLALLWTSGLAQGVQGQDAAPMLMFRVSPTKQTFAAREDIVLRFSLYNSSKESVFVSRKMYDEFVDLTIFGPDGNEVNRRGKRKIDSKKYSSQDFAVLPAGGSLSAKSVVSVKNGLGFIIDKPGRYRIKAEYSLGPPAYFAPFAGATRVPEGTFRSKTVTFCVDTCAATSESKQ